jgi:hypothetical protein
VLAFYLVSAKCLHLCLESRRPFSQRSSSCPSTSPSWTAAAQISASSTPRRRIHRLKANSNFHLDQLEDLEHDSSQLPRRLRDEHLTRAIDSAIYDSSAVYIRVGVWKLEDGEAVNYLKATMKVLARFPGLIMELDPQDDSMRTQTRWDWEHFGIRCTSPVSCPMLNEQYCFVICLTRTEKSS